MHEINIHGGPLLKVKWILLPQLHRRHKYFCHNRYLLQTNQLICQKYAISVHTLIDDARRYAPSSTLDDFCSLDNV